MNLYTTDQQNLKKRIGKENVNEKDNLNFIGSNERILLNKTTSMVAWTRALCGFESHLQHTL